MIRTATDSKAPSIPTEYSAAQHTLSQILLLHLLPGTLLTIAFILLGPWVKANHLPPMLSILLPILFLLIPIELGFLFFLGYRRNGRLSLEGIVLYRQPLPIKEYLIYPSVLLWFHVYILTGFYCFGNAKVLQAYMPEQLPSFLSKRVRMFGGSC